MDRVCREKESESREGQLESPTENVRLFYLALTASLCLFLASFSILLLDYPSSHTASDPQFSTAAQRSWAYGGGYTKPNVSRKKRAHDPKTSLAGFGNPVLPTHGRRANGHSFSNNKPRGLYNDE